MSIGISQLEGAKVSSEEANGLYGCDRSYTTFFRLPNFQQSRTGPIRMHAKSRDWLMQSSTDFNFGPLS